MKILLVSSSSGSRGGGELYLLYLARALAKRAHELTLWASAHPRMDELANSFSAVGNVTRARYRNTYDRPGRSLASYLDLPAVARISREWRRTRSDFVHVNKQNLEDGLDLLRATRSSGIPSLCTIHLTQSARYLKAQLAAVRDYVARRALFRYPGKLVTVLANRSRDLAQFLGASPRICMIPNGVPMLDLSRRDKVRAAVRLEFGIPAESLLTVAVGRMVAQKRPLLFLEYAERMRREIPDARFLWIGDGPLSAQWDERIAARGLQTTVKRVAWQSDVQRFLLAADLFLHVAEYEGLPLAILEAMAAALPCAVTSNLLAEMPFMQPANSIAIDASETWLNTLRQRAPLAELGAAARALAEADFSFEMMAERYEALYEEARLPRS